VTATKAGDSVAWKKATTSEEVTFSFGSAQGSVVVVTAQTGDAVDHEGGYTLAATGGSGSGSYTFSTSTSGCRIEDGKVMKTEAGTCVVTATKSKSTGYIRSAASAAKTFTLM